MPQRECSVYIDAEYITESLTKHSPCFNLVPNPM
jgi:hypothetical protein